MLGKTLSGRYKIVTHLGGGGFGQTYLAEDLQLPGNPLCVVKQLKPKATEQLALQIARRLFDREAQVLYQLGNHDQIPRLLAHLEEEQEFYLVQEFIQGEELKQELPLGKPLNETQVIVLLRDILKILEFVHDQGVIHRDIKPSNIIRRKQDGKIVLIDFGAVKQVSTQPVNSDGQTSLTVAIGSPGYMPNEQLSGKPQFCSDIYAVGMIGIQALTGLPPTQLPQDPKTSEILWHEKRLQNTLHQQVQASPELAEVLDKMVRYDYRQRYETATEALQALELVNLDVSTQPYVLPTPRVASPADATQPLVTRTLPPQTSPSAAETILGSTTPPAEPTQPLITATLPHQTLPPQEETISGSAVNSTESQSVSQTSSATVSTTPRQSRRLIGIGAGLATAVALTIGIYSFHGLSISKAESQWSQKISLSKTITGDSTYVNPVAISPDGKTLATGGGDGEIRLWNLQTGQLTNTLKSHSAVVYALSFSSDGQILASGSADATIKIWNWRAGNLLRTLKRRSEAGISALAISPDSQILVSGDRVGTMEIWNLSTGKPINFFEGHGILVTALAISPDGQTLVSSSQDNTIKLWELKTGQLIGTLTDTNSRHFFSVAMTPNGQKIASGSWDGGIRLWELSTGKLIETLRVGSDQIDSLVFKPNGQTLVSGSKDGAIRLWDLQTGKLRRTLSGHSAAVNSLAMTPDGQTLVSSSQDKTIRIWRSP